TATKKILHAAGLEIRRERKTTHQFAPAEEHKFDWLKNLNIQTVLDIGANTGQFASEIHQVLPQAMVYSFEPLKDCYEQLIDTMKSVGNFKAFDYALGNETSEVEMHRSKFSPSSSILPMGTLHKGAFPFTSEGTLERIRIKRLDDIADSLKLTDNLLV